MTSAADRARARRARWTGAVVELGTPKGALYDTLPLSERLRALTALNRRNWLAGGKAWPGRTRRADWPGEVLDLRRG